MDIKDNLANRFVWTKFESVLVRIEIKKRGGETVNMKVVTNVTDIFEQGNLHMSTKLRHFGGQAQQVVKYIMSKLRKYKGVFFESNSTIAENVGCSVRTVQNTIKRCEQLEIFIVSSRMESTFNGKMRQTTNKIQLLPYMIVEVAKEVVETIRETVSKFVDLVTNACQTDSNAMTKGKVNTVYNNNRNSYYKKPIRSEVVPNWLGLEYKAPFETEEIQSMREQLKKELQVFKR